jgi:hypothetical protein
MKCRVKEEERVRGMSPTDLDKWLKTTTTDDTGLTRPPDEQGMISSFFLGID